LYMLETPLAPLIGNI